MAPTSPPTIRMDGSILHHTQDGVLHITLNRPAQRHALTIDMYRQLASLFSLADTDDAIRVVLLSGADNYFTAGNDLADFIGFSAGDEFVPAHLLHAMSRCTRPIVAAVEGGAIGVGATMLMHCDVVYAGRSTKFLMPFINFGLCPENASSLLLPRNAGYKQAVRWLMLGEPFSADDARQGGMVTEVVDDRAALAAATAAARKLAAFPVAAVMKTKELLRAPDAQLVQDVLAIECTAFTTLLASPQAQAALLAFTAAAKKRPASTA